jgi:DNA polymerase III delta subunit
VSKWRNPPPVTIIAGSQDYYRRQELANAFRGADQSGRRVESIQGADRDALFRSLSSGGVFFEDKVLVVVRQPEKLDPKHIVPHGNANDNSVALLLYYEGDLKKRSAVSRIAERIPEKFSINYQAPKPWEADEAAQKFVIKEAKRLKVTLGDRLAANLVSVVGSDLGVLAFEVAKVAAVVRSEGKTEVEATHLRLTVASIMEAGALPVVETLASRNTPRLARALTAMRRTHSGDPTMKGIAFVGRNVTQWLHAAALISQGNSEDEISARLGIHPYIYKTKIAPVAKKWGEKPLARLLTSLADVERGVRSGHVNPWVEFECALVRSCRRDVHG